MSNAFLHGFLAKEVFIKQPQGFVDKAHPNLFANFTRPSLA